MAASTALRRWAPWVLGAVVTGVWLAFGPRGGADEAAVWRAIAGVVGDARAAAAVVAGAAAVIAAWVVIRIGAGGGEVAATAGAVAAATVAVAAGPWAHPSAPGTFALGAALVAGAIALGEVVAAGGGKAWAIACGVALGAAIAIDRSTLAIGGVVAALLVVRLWHGARWPVLVPVVATAAWVVVRIPAWLEPAHHVTAVRVGDERYALALADAMGAIAVVAAAAGVIVIGARRSTRWAGAMIVAAITGGIALDRIAGHAPGVVPIVGLALAAGAGVARLGRLVTIPVGQACIGAAAAVIVALPAALAAS